MISTRLLAGLMLWPLVAWGQEPVISTVVNAASYSRSFTSNGSHAIMPGSIATIFGANLAASTQTADTVPLPMSLGGTNVVFQGITAPLLYVSPTQINFQVPSNALSNNGGVVVTTPTGSSASYLLQGTDSALGIFTLDGSGCGRGLISNVSSDGTMSLNSTANSVSPGEYLAVYGTGLFIQAYKPPDGSPAPSYPLARSDGNTAGVFDSVFASGSYPYDWNGLAPGMIGVDQINVGVPETTREGCAVPFQVLAATDGNISQPVTIAVRQGGGACVDPPVAGYGQITWEKAVNTTAAGATENDTVTVSLQAAPGMQAPSLLPPVLETNVYYFGASCPIPGYRSLDAGTVTVQGPGFGPVTAPVVPLQQGQVSGPDNLSGGASPRLNPTREAYVDGYRWRGRGRLSSHHRDRPGNPVHNGPGGNQFSLLPVGKNRLDGWRPQRLGNGPPGFPLLRCLVLRPRVSGPRVRRDNLRPECYSVLRDGQLHTGQAGYRSDAGPVGGRGLPGAGPVLRRNPSLEVHLYL